MKAFVLNRYGDKDSAALQDHPKPTPKHGEVLIRVAAAGLNPVDYKTREGQLKPILRYDLPVVMGNELAGTVEGSVGIDGLPIGTRVFARTPKDRMGAFAEFAVVPYNCIAVMPDELSFEQAAAIPLAGLTALQALRDEIDLQPGSRVLVTGGAGGVGTFAIQIAKWLGAEVITTASPRGRELVERMGADRVIDYTSEKFEDEIGKVDAVFELIGGDTLKRAFKVVKKGGMVLSISATPEPQTARKDLDRGPGLAALFWLVSLPLRLRAWRHGARYRFLFMHPSGEELAELGQLVRDGRLDPVVDKVFPFDNIDEAFAYLEKGHAKGKVVVSMEQESGAV